MDGDDPGTASFQFRVLLERDDLDGGWVATCLDLPGCVSQGETDKEAVENLADAIGGVLTVRMQDHLPEVLRKRTAGDSDGTYQVALSV
jgi:predicted RNase H-like HicB family nuclease